MLHDESSHTKDGEIGIQNANGAFQGMEMEVTNDGGAEQFWPLFQKGFTLGQSIGTIHNGHPTAGLNVDLDSWIELAELILNP